MISLFISWQGNAIRHWIWFYSFAQEKCLSINVPPVQWHSVCVPSSELTSSPTLFSLLLLDVLPPVLSKGRCLWEVFIWRKNLWKTHKNRSINVVILLQLLNPECSIRGPVQKWNVTTYFKRESACLYGYQEIHYRGQGFRQGWRDFA